MDFSWKSDYELGIKEFDEQHKELLKIAKEIYVILCASEEGDGSHDYYDDIMHVLERLYDYTEYHFSSEEEEFKRVDYVDAQEHILEHEYFKQQLNKIIKRDIDANQYENMNDILEFLTKWLIHHILKTDMAYVDALKN